MGGWKDIDCDRCGTTSHARTRSDPELAYCPRCSSDAIDVYAGVYDGRTVDMFDCTGCSNVFNLAVSPEPGYCPVCGVTDISRFP